MTEAGELHSSAGDPGERRWGSETGRGRGTRERREGALDTCDSGMGGPGPVSDGTREGGEEAKQRDEART